MRPTVNCMHIKWTENSVSRRDLNSAWVKRMVVVGCGGCQGGGEGRGDLADSSSSTQIVIGFEVSITSPASGGAESRVVAGRPARQDRAVTSLGLNPPHQQHKAGVPGPRRGFGLR